jgi:hypothetical protein
VLRAAGLSRTETAAPPPRGRFRLTPTRVLVACVVIAAAVVAATPAFGLRDLIVDLVTGRTAIAFDKSRPAPARVKLQFSDFPLGAPPGMNPHVLAGQARQITLRTPSGQMRVIWVAPTRGGGFCSFGASTGGCISRATEKRLGAVSIDGGLTSRDGQWRALQVSGDVFSAKATTLTLEFADRQSMQLPFVYISAPIDAGFYYLGLPAAHQSPGHWPTQVVARDKQGDIVGVAVFRTPRTSVPPTRLPPRMLRPATPRALPLASSVQPTSPLQTATANGMTVVAGANGAVRFTAADVPAAVRRLLRGSVSYRCFRLARRFGLLDVRGWGVSGAFTGSVGLTLRGVGRPLDGCELDSARGHRWPDAFGSHSPIEVAFTAKGRAYFADRAAARDLALFVRSARMQKIRKEPDAQLLRDLKAAYGAELARSRIRYAPTSDGITFTEQSTSGKVFRVAIVKGRVKHSNVSPYAFVF